MSTRVIVRTKAGPVECLDSGAGPTLLATQGAEDVALSAHLFEIRVRAAAYLSG